MESVKKNAYTEMLMRYTLTSGYIENRYLSPVSCLWKYNRRIRKQCRQFTVASDNDGIRSIMHAPIVRAYAR